MDIFQGRRSFLSLVTVLLLLIASLTAFAASTEVITLTIGSTSVKQGDMELEASPIAPQLINERTMLPFRYLVQTVLGGEVDYEAATRTIQAEVAGRRIVMVVDQLQIFVDGVACEYGQAPVIVDNYTLVPLRAFEQVLDDLRWDAETQTVTLYPVGSAEASLMATVPPAPIEQEVSAPTLPTDISLSSTSVLLDAGKTVGLAATLSPADAVSNTVAWSSSNPAVATVSDSGLVTGMAKGKTVITARTENGLTAACDIEVQELAIATGVSLESTSEKVGVGEMKTLHVRITPTDAADTSLSWSSSNPRIVSVTDAGTLRGEAKGSATITVRTANGLSATCEVTVADKSAVDIQLPAYPVVLNHLDSYGQVESVVEVTSITVSQEYYQYSNKVTAKIEFEGKLVSSTRSGASYGYVEWQLLDSDGYVIDSNDAMTNRISAGQAFRGVTATIFDLVPGETYRLELVSGEGLSEEETSINLVLPSLPVRITEYNSSGTTSTSSIEVTDIQVEQEYRSYSNTVTIELLFSGKCHMVFERTNTNRKIIWTVKDSAGNVVDSGQAYTPILKEGDTFVDADSTIYNLKAGQTYYLEISTSVK